MNDGREDPRFDDAEGDEDELSISAFDGCSVYLDELTSNSMEPRRCPMADIKHNQDLGVSELLAQCVDSVPVAALTPVAIAAHRLAYKRFQQEGAHWHTAGTRSGPSMARMATSVISEY